VDGAPLPSDKGKKDRYKARFYTNKISGSGQTKKREITERVEGKVLQGTSKEKVKIKGKVKLYKGFEKKVIQWGMVGTKSSKSPGPTNPKD